MNAEELNEHMETVNALFNKCRRINSALKIAGGYSGVDGGHHKQWVIAQMVRALLGGAEEYDSFVREYEAGIDGPMTNEWDKGIAP